MIERFLKFLGFVFCVFLLNCKSSQLVPLPHFQAANCLVFHQLLAENLSEDMALTTKNDEVLLYFSILEQEENTWVERYHIDFPPFLFAESGQLQILADSLRLDSFLSEAIAVFALVELDEDNSENKVRQLLKQSLSSGRFLKQIDFREMNTLLADDDFLGLQYYPLNTIQKGKGLDIRFAGRHLFDPFAYVLTIGT